MPGLFLLHPCSIYTHRYTTTQNENNLHLNASFALGLPSIAIATTLFPAELETAPSAILKLEILVTFNSKISEFSSLLS